MIDPVISGVVLSDSRITGLVDDGQTLTGSAAAAQEITAELSGAIELTGEVSHAVELVGDVNADGALEGETHASGDVPIYYGDYEVTPQVNGQELKTKHLYMTQDVTIHAIPFFEVGNASGGNTVYIANEIEFK